MKKSLIKQRISFLKLQSVPPIEGFFSSRAHQNIYDLQRRYTREKRVLTGALVIFLALIPTYFLFGVQHTEMIVLSLVSLTILYLLREDIKKRLVLLDEAKFLKEVLKMRKNQGK